MSMVEGIVQQAMRRQAAAVEEMFERALVTGTHGVAVVTNVDLVLTGAYHEYIITDLVPWGEIYEFPTPAAWESFKARQSDTP